MAARTAVAWQPALPYSGAMIDSFPEPARTPPSGAAMRPARWLPILAATCLISSCGQPTGATQDVPTNPAANDVAAMRNDIAAVEDRVTRETLTRRVDALEKRVGMLEVTPEKIDLDLLTQRVQALEAKSSVSDLVDTPTPKTVPKPPATSRSTP